MLWTKHQLFIQDGNQKQLINILKSLNDAQLTRNIAIAHIKCQLFPVLRSSAPNSWGIKLQCSCSSPVTPQLVVQKWADPPMLQALLLWDVNATSLTCSLDDCPVQMRIFLDFPTLRRIEVEFATLADCQNGQLTSWQGWSAMAMSLG